MKVTLEIDSEKPEDVKKANEIVSVMLPEDTFDFGSEEESQDDDDPLEEVKE